tara:strand:- start:1935 stop:2075 length:141 start_codon:yes stop_codon:yes gene_type:complete
MLSGGGFFVSFWPLFTGGFFLSDHVVTVTLQFFLPWRSSARESRKM